LKSSPLGGSLRDDLSATLDETDRCGKPKCQGACDEAGNAGGENKVNNKTKALRNLIMAELLEFQ